MDAPNPPPPNAPFHPAPAQGWRPMSGLAVTAFVLSLVCILVAVFIGIWVSQLVPLGLAVLTLVTVKPGQRRGRVLALWAIVIAIGSGSCSYLLHGQMRNEIGNVGESVLAALSAKASPADSEKALKAWFAPAVLEKHADRIATVRERYAQVEQEFGAYTGEVDLGRSYFGVWPLLLAPQGVVEIGTDEVPPGWAQGSVFWLPAVFDKGRVMMAIVLEGADQDSLKNAVQELQGAEEAAIVEDIRFFRAK